MASPLFAPSGLCLPSRAIDRRADRVDSNGMVWEIVFMLVLLKIPIVYLCMVVWWAIRAEPRDEHLAVAVGVSDTPDGGSPVAERRVRRAAPARPAAGAGPFRPAPVSTSRDEGRGPVVSSLDQPRDDRSTAVDTVDGCCGRRQLAQLAEYDGFFMIERIPPGSCPWQSSRRSCRRA